MDRLTAARLDAADPLAPFRSRFVVADPDLVYLDGNSLGRLPRATVDALSRTIEEEWGRGLIRSWSDWVDLPLRAGNLLAPLIGGGEGETLVVDQTSVNLYKLAEAAMDTTGRADIVTDEANFPSDRYVLEAVAARRGGRVRVVASTSDGTDPDHIVDALDAEVGLVTLSHVAYQSAAIADGAAISALAHEAGAMVLWDLSHSVGAVPVDLTGWGADLAVGCTYKHLNGGPGAPAFLWVRRDLQERLTQPIHGWFGHRDMFAFSADYDPAPDIRRFGVGTPPILSLTAAASGIALVAEAGIEAIRAKSIGLTELIVDRFDAELEELGFGLASPRDPQRRGGHLSLRHPAAAELTAALVERGVIPDYRTPDLIRVGVSPLYTTHVEVWDAMAILAELVRTGGYPVPA